MCDPSHPWAALWGAGLIQKVLDHDDTPRLVREAAYLIRSPEAVELHLRKAKGAEATRRASLQINNAIQTVLAWTGEQGWSAQIDT
ncbi:hypothetical protein ACLM45_13625 [Synechococcus sp. A10-1-5-9]|uniref:hypothetical protein n=1 Tax=Synechococcus sp. A10-1-5-9 TaxID=3392295 RepID=UPI0039EAB536